MSTGEPADRVSPDTSRKASSMDNGSTNGVVSAKTLNTARLASTYASIRGGTIAASGHSARTLHSAIGV